ncbi:MAG: hypothetical protein CM15mP83_0050 [Flavobacteriaceae bacterium]|nr:MAG: hypothetical protein CM15mP83_0050 [Flavobacteriaceae bacterium]
MLWDAIKKQQHKLLLISGCLIFAGALGNIIDSLFYGLLFSNSYGQVASLFPKVGLCAFVLGMWSICYNFPCLLGYGLLGCLGLGQSFFLNLFSNLADTAISTGVGDCSFFKQAFFPKKLKTL